MLRILIVDDHHIVSQGLKHLVEGNSNNTMTTEPCASEDALKLLHRNAHEVVLLGMTLSGTNHIELLKQMRAIKPRLPVLILSASDDEQYCERLLKAGASGILVKQSDSNELVDAITKVSRGRKYVSPSLAERMTNFSPDRSLPLQETLSDREYEVMVAIASGKRIKQISNEMSLSIKTVSTYHSRIMQKLKLENDAQLIRYAIEQGIIQDGVTVREKLVLTELSIRTAPIVATVKEIWRLRKDVIFVIVALSILTYVILNYLIRFIF